MKRLLPIFCVLVFTINNSSAQYFEWVNRLPGIDQSHQTSMTLDAAGNIYCTGYFKNTLDFDPDTGVFNLTAVGTSEDAFLAKYDANGKFKWAASFGGTGSDLGVAVKIDNFGNVLFAASTIGSIDYDPGPLVNIVHAFGGSDFVIAKFDSMGNYIWAKSFGGIDNETKIVIDVDSANNVYAAGAFSGTVDFNSDTTVSFYITATATNDIFMSKLDSNGNFVWAKTITGSTYSGILNAIDVDAFSNILITGSAPNAPVVDWDPGPGVYYLPSSNHGAYVAKYDSAGNFGWVKEFVATNNPELGTGILTNAAGDIYSIGQFRGQIDLDPDTAITQFRWGLGLDDIYISKINSAGNFIWGFAFGGPNNETATGLAIDAAENIYLTGEFTGTVDFNPDTTSTYAVGSNIGSTDFYGLKLDSAGIFQWLIHAGGGFIDRTNAIAVDKKDNVYLCGKFQGTADLNPDSAGQNFLTATGGYNLFLLKLNQCQEQFSTINSVACDSFIYNGTTYYSSGTYDHVFQNVLGCDSTVTLNLTIANNDTIISEAACGSFFYNGQTYDSSGVYYQTLTNSFGCDSNVTLSLSVTTIDTTLMQNGFVLLSNFNQTGTTYQWIDCNSGALIPFETNQFLVVTSPGSYGVMITYNNCTDTSACINVTNVGINENHFHRDIRIYPNPANGIFKIESSTSLKNCIVKVYNCLGDMIFIDELKNQNTIDLRNKPDGLYLVKVMMNEKEIVKNRLCKIN